jgi:COMPASS component SWD3
LTISPDSLYVATASDDGTINVNLLRPGPSSVRHPPPLRQLKAHTAPVLSVAFSPKSNLLVSGSFDESAIIWDVKGGSPLRVLPAHSEAVWTVGWDNEGGMVLTGSTDGLM